MGQVMVILDELMITIMLMMMIPSMMTVLMITMSMMIMSTMMMVLMIMITLMMMAMMMVLWRLLSQEEGEEFTDCLSHKPTPPGNIASRYLVLISCYLAYLVIFSSFNLVSWQSCYFVIL